MTVCELKFPVKSLCGFQVLQVTKYLNDGLVCPGLGVGRNMSMAYRKAKFECFEREAVLAHGLDLGFDSTNGVAAHRWGILAKKAALAELIERDAFLIHWYLRHPFKVVHLHHTFDSLRAELKYYHRIDLVLCETTLGLKSTTVCFLINSKGGFCIGLSCGKGQKLNAEKAILEACINYFLGHGGRSAKVSLESLTQGVCSLESHRTFWLHSSTLPSWVFDKAEKKDIRLPITHQNFQFVHFPSATASVWGTKHSEMLDLNIGYPNERTRRTLLKRVRASNSEFELAHNLPLHLHPIP